MSWFKKKSSPEPPEDNSGDDLDILGDLGIDMSEAIDFSPMLKRRFVWDLVPCNVVPTSFPAFGLNNGSAEGMVFEHQASHDRMSVVSPLIDVIDISTGLVSEIIAGTIIDLPGPGTAENLEKQIGADYRSLIETSYKRVLTSGVTAIIANLVEMGFLEIVGEGSQ